MEQNSRLSISITFIRRVTSYIFRVALRAVVPSLAVIVFGIGEQITAIDTLLLHPGGVVAVFFAVVGIGGHK